MTKMEFKDITFHDDKDYVKLIFLKGYYMMINRAELEKIGSFTLHRNAIEFSDVSEKSAERKFNVLLSAAFRDMKSLLNDKPAVYIHRNSGIPLMGNTMFGIVDKGTNIIEVKPNTGCNMGCVFCSVDEGPMTRKILDYVVEKDYLVEELDKLIRFKGCNNLIIYINVHGEPMLYSPLAELIHDMAEFREVKTITIISNGMLLTKQRIDELVAAGLNQMSVSVSGFDRDFSKKIMGSEAYDIERVKENLAYAAKRLKLIITPVWLSGVNDEQMPKIIRFAKEIGAEIAIQNFLINKRGRNPVKEISFEKFYEKLEKLEKELGVGLRGSVEKLEKTKELPRPFKRNDVITVEIMCPGRFPKEKICVSKDRNIVVLNCAKDSGRIKIKLVKSEHNIFSGVPV